jgi:hypothetical protein
MVVKTEEVSCRFIGDFKVGDNLVLNANALTKLMKSNDDSTFNKLIVVQAGSIVEAALDQIIYRAQHFKREGVPEISEKDRQEIADTKLEQFYKIIEAMKKYGLLDALGGSIYDDLHKLREYRNRIHIQNDTKPPNTSRDEDKAFTKELVTWALGFTIKILKHLSEKYPRPPGFEIYAHELTMPTGA